MNNDIISMIMSSGNPQALLMNLIQQKSGSNPIMSNLLEMANTNNAQGIEALARNLCKERGVNADELFSQISGQVRRK